MIVDFEKVGDAIRAGARQMLVIDSFCASACMVVADRARPRACITPRAQFAYHETNYNRPIPLNTDLHGRIMSHGGYPSYAAMGNAKRNRAAILAALLSWANRDISRWSSLAGALLAATIGHAGDCFRWR